MEKKCYKRNRTYKRNYGDSANEISK